MFCRSVFEYILRKLPQLKGNYLEIGIYEGDSVAFLADVFPDRFIYAIDPFIEDGNTSHHSCYERGQVMESKKYIALNNIFGKANIKFYEMTSKSFYNDVLNDEFCQNANISIVFIDGSHWEEDVSNDVQIALKLIGTKQGVICFDDLNIPDVKKVYDEFLSKNESRILRIDELQPGVTAVNLNSINK